jgi:hypothetical protein
MFPQTSFGGFSTLVSNSTLLKVTNIAVLLVSKWLRNRVTRRVRKNDQCGPQLLMAPKFIFFSQKMFINFLRFHKTSDKRLGPYARFGKVGAKTRSIKFAPKANFPWNFFKVTKCVDKYYFCIYFSHVNSMTMHIKF